MTVKDWQRYEALVPSLRQVGHRCRVAVPESQSHFGFSVVVAVANMSAYLSRQGLPLSIPQAKEVAYGSIAKLDFQTVLWQDGSCLLYHVASSMSPCRAVALP